LEGREICDIVPEGKYREGSQEKEEIVVDLATKKYKYR
jgi:hypothetical protein